MNIIPQESAVISLARLKQLENIEEIKQNEVDTARGELNHVKWQLEEEKKKKTIYIKMDYGRMGCSTFGVDVPEDYKKVLEGHTTSFDEYKDAYGEYYDVKKLALFKLIKWYFKKK